MRLLLDEMIGPRVAAALRDQGLDVVGVVEHADLRALPDAAVLDHARATGRVLVTRNASDFARLHRLEVEGPGHAGVVMVTEAAFPQRRNLVGALVRALSDAADQGLLPAPGHVLFLSAPDA